MILRPVRPQSPNGPPTTNRPVGLMWNTVSLFAQHKAGVALNGAVDPGPIVLLILIAVVVAVGAAMAFERRDLTAG